MFVVNGKGGDESELKRLIAIQGSEILAKNERLNEKEEELQSWKKMAEEYETALRRAGVKIAADSNKKLGIDPQTTSDGCAKENMKLAKALPEHAALTELGEKDIATVSV